MNCEEFRDAVGADPSFDGNAAHLAECADCAAYRARMRALDEKLAQALALPVPPLRMPPLPEIDTANVVALPGRRMIRPWLAVAASVALAAMVGIRLFDAGQLNESLEDQIIAHLDHEQNSLRVTRTAVSDERLRLVVADDVAQLDHSAGLITYAQSCSINGHSVPHLVVQGETGPVTILLMPDEHVAEARQIIGDNVQGVILPVGNGSIAIIGNSGERLERIQKNVVDSVTWDT